MSKFKKIADKSAKKLKSYEHKRQTQRTAAIAKRNPADKGNPAQGSPKTNDAQTVAEIAARTRKGNPGNAPDEIKGRSVQRENEGGKSGEEITSRYNPDAANGSDAAPAADGLTPGNVETIRRPGRPPGSKGKSKGNAAPLGLNDTEKKVLEQMKDFAETATPTPDAVPNNITEQKESVLIDGYFLLIFVDTLFPFAIHLIVKRFVGKEIPPDKIMLTKEQMERLQPLADKAAEYMAIRMNPVAAFMFAISTQYTRNATEFLFTKI